MRLKICKKLRAASLNLKFTGSYKKMYFNKRSMRYNINLHQAIPSFALCDMSLIPMHVLVQQKILVG